MSELIQEAVETHTLSFEDANVTAAISPDGAYSVNIVSPGGLSEFSFDIDNWNVIVAFVDNSLGITRET